MNHQENTAEERNHEKMKGCKHMQDFIVTPTVDHMVRMYTGRPSRRERPPVTKEKFFGHLHTITHHKLLVL